MEHTNQAQCAQKIQASGITVLHKWAEGRDALYTEEAKEILWLWP